MKTFSKVLITCLILIILPQLVSAQIDPGCDPLDPACPIDGGLSLLLAAGAGLGVRRMMRKY